jgi:hypothetical protein
MNIHVAKAQTDILSFTPDCQTTDTILARSQETGENMIQFLIDGPLVIVNSFICRCIVLLSILVLGVVGGRCCWFLIAGCWLQVFFRTTFFDRRCPV